MEKRILNYFGYGTNRDLEMMAAMIGRRDIEGKKGRLLSFELCIQKASDIADKILETAPTKTSPREIVTSTFDENFELYIIRPKENAITYGTIWKLTKEEYGLVRDWELLDFGMQEDIKAVAMDEDGKVINVITHGSMSPNMPASRVIEGPDYEDYIVPKEAILKVAADDYEKHIKKY
ncbi:MAG: hypothetical protein U0944_03890 [Candidatus Moranbacteria bacterium]|nr:hypothetical protein [Candidatus Moranbacteria bacterium]